MTDVAGLSIGEVAERTGLSVHALRFYEHEGLLASPVRRAPSGRRAYSEDDVEWLTVCVNFRSSGMPLRALRRYATLVRQGEGNEEERLALLRQHRRSIEEQLTQLAACLKVIDYKVDAYERRLAEGTAGTLWGIAGGDR
jgi:DNA-binding transcriptional MerR regulator